VYSHRDVDTNKGGRGFKYSGADRSVNVVFSPKRWQPSEHLRQPIRQATMTIGRTAGEIDLSSKIQIQIYRLNIR
jgi:hypothetical protein